MIIGFKPQRGKFTPKRFLAPYYFQIVSNPNGVNLHLELTQTRQQNENCFKPQRGKFTLGTP